MKQSNNSGLDLVEIVSQATPPVCRIMNYGKYLFEKGKKKISNKKQKKMQVKEVKIRPGTDIGDYKVKLKQSIKFLTNGDKVKITLRFRGREMIHQEFGLDMLNRFKDDLKSYACIEHQSKIESRQMSIILVPKKNLSHSKPNMEKQYAKIKNP